MNRGEAERALREAGFVEVRGTRHTHWKKGPIVIGIATGSKNLTTDAEAAIRRKMKKAARLTSK